eukprot:5835916-Pyramimonas_sp.AAC.1
MGLRACDDATELEGRRAMLPRSPNGEIPAPPLPRKLIPHRPSGAHPPRGEGGEGREERRGGSDFKVKRTYQQPQRSVGARGGERARA